jgi:hypothetical protein
VSLIINDIIARVCVCVCKAGSQMGLPRSTCRINRVSLGQNPNGFLLRLDPVLGLGRSGRPAGPDQVSKLFNKRKIS